jgi:hypothetical protein
LKVFLKLTGLKILGMSWICPFPQRKSQRAKAHTIKYGTRIKTIPKHVQLVPEKSQSIFVGNKIAEKNTAIDDEIRESCLKQTSSPHDEHLSPRPINLWSNHYIFQWDKYIYIYDRLRSVSRPKLASTDIIISNHDPI